MELWVEEKHEETLGIRYKVKKTLYSQKSDFQQVDVVETEGHGKMLLNDGVVMICERDEFVYHEMIAHTPLYIHPEPRKVLVIGGGDGGTVREVIKHPSVELCTLVEIDECVLEACQKHIPLTSAALQDERAEVLVEDGVEYVKKCAQEGGNHFDVILVDSTDPIGPATPLFNESFYKDVEKSLRENGIVVSQCESPFYNQDMQEKILGIKASLFPKTAIYNYSNLTYPGGLWSFSFASKGPSPFKDFRDKDFERDALELRYYNKEIHKACFSIPSFMREKYKDTLKV
jgi:spermidine synthase